MDKELNEQITLLILYKGDITKVLKASGSTCPYRLTPDGDTEQSIECFRGGGGMDVPAEQLALELEPFMLDDAKINGQIKSHRWVIAQRP